MIYSKFFKDQSSTATPQLEKRSLNQFIKNINCEQPNILRIVRMISYAGFESTNFSTDHAAWRDTTTDSSSALNDGSRRSVLRWTDVAMQNAVQFWRIVPGGFGAFFDIRSGHVWIIVATPILDHRNVDRDNFTRSHIYLQEFSRLRPIYDANTRLEAIRLEPGTRL